jgi:hypothetical protein
VSAESAVSECRECSKWIGERVERVSGVKSISGVTECSR